MNDNAYLNEVMPLSQGDHLTRLTMFALASSYLKEYLPDKHPNKAKMEYVEAEAIKRAMAEITDGEELQNTARMLLIHHAILNPKMHQQHWSLYMYQLRNRPGEQACFIMARHAIWLMAILPLTMNYQFQKYDYNFVGVGEEQDLTRVNGIVGTSRMMLYFQYLITEQAKVCSVPL